MKIYSRSAKVLILACFLVSIGIATVFAGEINKNTTKTSKNVVKETVDYPANLTTETVNIVGQTTKNTAEIVIDTVEVTGKTLTGDVKKAPEIVVTPIRETGETINDTATGILKAPGGAVKNTDVKTQQ